MWYAVYRRTAEARSVHVPNKRDASGVTRTGRLSYQISRDPLYRRAKLTLLRLPAIDSLAEFRRDETLHGIEHAENGGEGDPEGEGAAVEGRGGEDACEEVAGRDGHGGDVGGVGVEREG